MYLQQDKNIFFTCFQNIFFTTYMPHKLIYIMGVAGSGKTTIGQLLAAKTGYVFYDADQFHPQKNMDKMKAGVPLTDEDRWPWLAAINNFVSEKLVSNNIILACSALKQAYRKRLDMGIEQQVIWVFLNGSYKIIMSRMQKRSGHFMPPSLLRSQFDALELPQDALKVDITLAPDAIVEDIISQI
ncbi:MAG: gluconokinase [Ferruginibacter sp.]